MLRRIRSILPTLFVLVVFILPGTAGAFDVSAFIEVNGSPLPGVNTPNPDKAGGIPLSSFSQGSDRRLGSTGIPSGTIEKGPITFTKAVDGASPLLFKALANNEVVNDALFKFFRRTSGGVDEVYFQTMEQTSPIAGTTHTN